MVITYSNGYCIGADAPVKNEMDLGENLVLQSFRMLFFMRYFHAAQSVSPSTSKTKAHIDDQANFRDGGHLSGFGWGVFEKIKQPRRRRFLFWFCPESIINNQKNPIFFWLRLSEAKPRHVNLCLTEKIRLTPNFPSCIIYI
jgi:hypothetical protein